MIDTHFYWKTFYEKMTDRKERRLFLKIPFETMQSGQAIDLGCGDGTETLALLQKDWQVLAIDQENEAIKLVKEKCNGFDKLETQITSFEKMILPKKIDLIYAGLSLPFCHPDKFQFIWSKLIKSLNPRSYFAAHLLGTKDGWADNPEMTFHTLDQVNKLLSPFDIKYFLEVDQDGFSAFDGQKHWHMFEFVGQKRL